jgi:hypothetical protein
MSAGTTAQHRRARRLLRWYPASWRARYGEEFAELLLAEMQERPHSWRRTANVAASGLLARCTLAGLTGHELSPPEQIRACLATLGCALAALLTFGLFLLAQLATGWQWAAAGPANAATGTLVMAAAAAGLVLIALAAVIPVGWQVAVAGRSDARLARPALIALGCAAVIVCGARHFENGWPGTGGLGPEHALVPGGLAAFGWASTLSVSAYWAHPGLWGIFPAAEMAWMMLSPVAWAGLVIGCVTVLRRLALPVRMLRYLGALAVAATPAAVVFLAGAATWVLGRPGARAGTFRPGLVDVASLAVMSVAVVIALRVVARIRRARLALSQAG